MTKTKTCYGDRPHDAPLELCDKEAAELYKFMQEHPDWEEKYGIALFGHKDGLFLLDCNAITATVYRRDSVDEKYYCGHDGFYAFIDNVDGLKEWFNDEFSEPVTTVPHSVG